MTRAPLADLVPRGRGAFALSFDEGGIRCERGSAGGYLPYSRMADVSVEAGSWAKRTFASAVDLVITSTEGDFVELRVGNGDPLEAQRVVLFEIARRRGAPHAPPRGLARGDAPLVAWLDRVRLASSTETYRESAITSDVLVAVLEAPTADIEARAAAAHALVACATGDALVAAAKAFVVHALPPLVVAAGGVAPGGDSLVPREVMDDMNRFVPEDDALPLRMLLDARSHDAERGRAVAEALDAAKALATAEAEAAAAREDASPKGGRRLRGLGLGAASGGSSWVGRSWAL